MTEKLNPDLIKRIHIRKAVVFFKNEGGVYPFRQARRYSLIFDGDKFPLKAIVGKAYEYATGRVLLPGEFLSSESGPWHRRLMKLNISIVDELITSQENSRPEKIITEVVRYVRSAQVVSERLRLANGFCEECGCKAPFLRTADGSPYLEVHHIEPLSRDGMDSVENTKAVCPNCHRRIHDVMGLGNEED